MGRKHAALKHKRYADRASTSSSARSSISTASSTTPSGAMTPPTPLSASGGYLKRLDTPQDRDDPPAAKVEASKKLRWIRRRWMPQPCRWWPCRTVKSITQVITIFLRGFATEDWRDHLFVVLFLGAVLFGCWIAMEGLLSIFRPVFAQDANCSIVYVTIPGPIITVSIIGASASDPARGTYYYSVVDGTTQWLNSQAPPSRQPVLSTAMSTGSLYTSSWSMGRTSDLSVPGPPTPTPSLSTPGLPATSPTSSGNSLASSSPTGTTTIMNTVSQGLSMSSTRPFSATSPKSTTLSETWFTLSLPNPSLPLPVSSPSAVPDLSTRSQGSIPKTSSFLSISLHLSFSRSLLASSSTQPIGSSPSSPASTSSRPSSSLSSSSTSSSILTITLTSSSISSSVAITSIQPSSSPTLPTSSSSLETVTLKSSRVTSISLSSRLTITLTSTWGPPVPTSSTWLSSIMSSSLYLTSPLTFSTSLAPTSGPLPSWGNVTSSSLYFNTSSRELSISSILSSSSRTLLFITTISRELPASGRNSSVGAADLTTKVLSFGDTAYSFVFPTPIITTTVSYWTGSYPTASGTEPDVPDSTTRTIRQTPLSALPSFEKFTPAGFKTIVTTVDGATHTTVAAAAASDATLCGEYGNFSLTFDDTSVGPSKNDVLPVNGMTNPYHHLFYANGYTYVPDKWEPYPAVSQPNVAMFLPFGGLLPNTPFAGSLLPGEIGAGPRASVSAYWFNAYYGYFGCALNGITRCTLRISGYQYDATLKQEVLAVEQNVTIPACYGYIKCRLTQVYFNDGFRALSGIQFNAYTYNLGIPQIFMMDSLQMEWYNSSCAAGILRIGHR